ncbi:hypothetical protein QBC37DRAFT_487455 [Rhypophila decipiens]|uniref:Uncharacterized protein n=1 Tax=Rhypophila decipiens TaxID=261697 RepID=A0AAN6XVM1_9PEZI|nr:hypothetical protein QBC37DRAFT_487455 [Rhypophila decipiens]
MLTSRITRLAPRAAGAASRNTTTARASYQMQQSRNIGAAPGQGQSEGDMGGPGGQEAYPFTNKKHRTYATQTAVASVAALGALYYFLGGSKDTKTTTSTGADKGQAGTNPNGQAMDKVEKFGRSRN